MPLAIGCSMSRPAVHCYGSSGCSTIVLYMSFRSSPLGLTLPWPSTLRMHAANGVDVNGGRQYATVTWPAAEMLKSTVSLVPSIAPFLPPHASNSGCILRNMLDTPPLGRSELMPFDLLNSRSDRFTDPSGETSSRWMRMPGSKPKSSRVPTN